MRKAKWTAVFLILLAVLFLMACGAQTEQPPASADPLPPTAEKEENAPAVS